VTADGADGEQSRADRGCIFCGATPLSKEHAIPRWIGEALHESEPPGASWETHYQFGRPAETMERRHAAPSNRPVVEVNCVCVPCNTGWMSRLEGQAKPLLLPMIRGEATRLDLPAQLVLATWAVKTTLVLEFMRRGMFVATPEMRTALMERTRPPDTFRVRLAAVARPTDQPLRFQTFVATTQGPDGSPDVLCSTLLIAHLALQVWGGTGAGPVDLRVVGTRIDDAVMVWPPVPTFAIWPPINRLDETQLETFMREPLPGATSHGLVRGW
jgi:hypothetical protein